MVLDQSFSGFSSSFEDMEFMVNLWKVLKGEKRRLGYTHTLALFGIIKSLYFPCPSEI